MKNKIYLYVMIAILLVLNNRNTFAQWTTSGTNIYNTNTGNVGINSSSPNASAQLDIASTTKGVLVPRMTKAQRDAIGSPATGLLIYQTNNTPGFYYYSGTSWTAVSPKSANTSLSNLVVPTAVNVELLPGTDNTTNIGSVTKSWKNIYTDGSLYLDGTKFIDNSGTDNTLIGNTGNTSIAGNSNTFVGKSAGSSNTSGSDNSLFGLNAGYHNTTGNNNSIYGVNAGFFNTSGYENSFFGKLAGYSNTTGYDNSFYGKNAGYSNLTGSNNSIYGVNAGYSNTAGSSNSFFGLAAGLSNTTGYRNSFFGDSAGYSNTTGPWNSFFGKQAGYSNTTGENNSFYGTETGYSNTSGRENTFFGAVCGRANTTGLYNSFFGFNAGDGNTVGNYNSFFGEGAGFYNTSGSNNSIFGNFAGLSLTIGNNNCFFGQYSGVHNTSGSFNTYLGYNADGDDSGTVYNATALGNGSRAFSSNEVRIGNSSVTSIGGYVNWSNISDGRYKKNVKEDVKGLDFIIKLRPVTYTLDVDGIEKVMHPGDAAKGDQKEIHPSSAEEQQAKTAKSKIIYSGFIAQDVEKTAKEIGYDFSGVDAPKNDKDLYGLRYAEFVVPLVKAVQEQQSAIEEKDAKVAELQSTVDKQQQEIEDLKAQMQQFDQSLSQCCTSYQSSNSISEGSTIDLAKLEQNVPNPFTQNTIIKLYIPQSTGNAVIKVYSLDGVELKSFDVNQSGYNEISITGNTLASGVYAYTLIIDGRAIDTKQMILTK